MGSWGSAWGSAPTSTTPEEVTAIWGSAALLQKCKDFFNRPASDLGMTDAIWYRLLTQGQYKWFQTIATHAPEVLYIDPELLTTSDGGETYDFLYTPFPGGQIEVRGSRSGEVLSIGQDWESGADFVWEGNRLRVPDGRTRSFSNGPYARYVPMPVDVAADSEPNLNPPPARQLMVYDACAAAAVRMGSHDPGTFRDLEQRLAWGDPRNPGDVGLIGALKTQIFPGNVGSDRWWLSVGGEGYSSI